MLVSMQDSGLLESKICVSFTLIYLEPSTVPDTEKLLHKCVLTVMIPSVTDFDLTCYFIAFDVPILILECGKRV